MQNNLQSQTSPAGGVSSIIPPVLWLLTNKSLLSLLLLQVFSHSNVMNPPMHFNSMGYNNYDKFAMPSIPPPGFQSGNANGKKTECN